MLVVQGDGALKGGVANGVAVSEILGYDPGAGFVFLRYFLIVTVGVILRAGGAC